MAAWKKALKQLLRRGQPEPEPEPEFTAEPEPEPMAEVDAEPEAAPVVLPPPVLPDAEAVAKSRAAGFTIYRHRLTGAQIRGVQSEAAGRVHYEGGAVAEFQAGDYLVKPWSGPRRVLSQADFEREWEAE